MTDDASAEQVALWAAALTYDPRKCLDADATQCPTCEA
jgi:hypothetical protein